jgi:hypothetical protein
LPRWGRKSDEYPTPLPECWGIWLIFCFTWWPECLGQTFLEFDANESDFSGGVLVLIAAQRQQLPSQALLEGRFWLES